MTTPTPRTDAEFVDDLEEMAQRVTSQHRDFYATKTIREAAVRFHNISKELTAKTAELEEAKRQMDSWLKEHDSQLRTTRAAAFEEAADMGLTVDDKWVQSGIDTLSAEIHKKAASIRKGEL